jgi:NAD(P)-dependent dehydrogenase (short-subunit alcohol dehydrogenase family)
LDCRAVSEAEHRVCDLTGRCVLVTGGSRGIGRAACVGFAQAGADVVVHYHTDREAAERVAAEIRNAGRRAAVVQADITSAGEVEAMMPEVAEFAGDGGLHVLFNNAGVYPSGSLESLSVEEWDRVMAINARGPFLCTRAALPLLKAAPEARVINIGTVMAYRGIPGMLHYIASKSAVIGFTRVLARELAPDGITVNCVSPSMVQTETAERDYGGDEVPVIAEQAIQRYQQPEDLVGLLVFLASESSAFVTGQTILADGGRIFL